ncbi:MAG TPA: hypothetical protein VES19_12195 [Candidatus Limnocylindrales bacterium]|nr:hypothetical protein [Candidatus Limnocylindrales bacterium]
MTDDTDPRRQATTGFDQEPEADEAPPERELHPVLAIQAAAIGGMAAGFPVGAIAAADTLANDDPDEGPSDTADDDTNATSRP